MTIRNSGRSLLHRLNILTEFYKYEEPLEIHMHFWDHTMILLKRGNKTETLETIYHKDKPESPEPRDESPITKHETRTTDLAPTPQP